MKFPRSQGAAVLGAGVLGAVLGAGVLHAQTLERPAQLSQPGRPPILPLTQLDERALAADLDNKTFTLTFAQPVPVRDLLLLLVRGTALSMIPDPETGGSFIGELKNVTVRQALGLILPPLGLDYSVNGSFIRVFRREPETRLFDVNYIATERVGTISVGGGPGGPTTARVTSTTHADVFADIANGVRTLISAHGTFNVDRKAGLLQVNDFPERLDRVATYLDAVHERVHRQVEIDARVLEVELNDPNAAFLDLAALGPGAPASPPGSRQMLSGLGPGDVTRFLGALATQGKVTMLADPHILTLNNEPAVVRAVVSSPQNSRESKDSPASRDEEGVTLAVTPQIAGGGTIMLSLSPIVSLRADDGSGKGAPATAIRETDTLARITDGATLVLAGFTREQEVRERQASGTRGGWFGRSTVVTKKHIELVILLTPRTVSSGEAP